MTKVEKLDLNDGGEGEACHGASRGSCGQLQQALASYGLLQLAMALFGWPWPAAGWPRGGQSPSGVGIEVQLLRDGATGSWLPYDGEE